MADKKTVMSKGKAKAKAPIKASAKVTVKAPTKTPPKVTTKAPVKASVKAPVKVSVKVPTKTPVKTTKKAPVKAPTKVSTKAPAKTSAKASGKAKITPMKPPVKVVTKVPAKALGKTKAPVKASGKASVKTSVKVPAKSPAKTAAKAPIKTESTTPQKTKVEKLEHVNRALGKNETVDFQYRPGQKIFHFWYGAGLIERKSIEVINNQKKPYFVLTFNANDVVYKVPEDRIDKINIRPISSMQELEEAIKALQQNVTKAMNFKAIENECQTKITSGKLIDVVEVIKVIYRHRKKQEKLGKISPLSTSFEKLLQTAKRLFASEWAVLKNLSYETCQQKINKMIDQYIRVD